MICTYLRYLSSFPDLHPQFILSLLFYHIFWLRGWERRWLSRRHPLYPRSQWRASCTDSRAAPTTATFSWRRLFGWCWDSWKLPELCTYSTCPGHRGSFTDSHGFAQPTLWCQRDYYVHSLGDLPCVPISSSSTVAFQATTFPEQTSLSLQECQLCIPWSCSCWNWLCLPTRYLQESGPSGGWEGEEEEEEHGLSNHPDRWCHRVWS